MICLFNIWKLPFINIFFTLLWVTPWHHRGSCKQANETRGTLQWPHYDKDGKPAELTHNLASIVAVCINTRAKSTYLQGKAKCSLSVANWWMRQMVHRSWEGCLSLIMHIQDAESMHTERWNLSLFVLYNVMSNHNTNLSVSIDSFIGSNTFLLKGPRN